MREARGQWEEHEQHMREQQLEVDAATAAMSDRVRQLEEAAEAPLESSEVEPPAPSTTALVSAVQRGGFGGPGGGSSSRRVGGGARGGRAKDKGMELERVTNAALLQLRIACLHPQVR